MRKLFIYISLLFSPLAIYGQSETDKVTFIGAEGMKAEAMPQASVDSTSLSAESSLDALNSSLSMLNHSNTLGYPFGGWGHPTLFSLWGARNPWGWGAGTWDLHEGLNGEVGAGVTVGWGKNNPFRGASFFTDVSLMYVKPVSDKWTLAIGGTLSQFRMFNENQIMGSVTALANYQFNEHLSATIYGAYHDNLNGSRKSFIGFDPFLDRCAEVGTNITYKFNNNMSVEVGFSEFIPINNNARPWLPAPRQNERILGNPICPR